MEDLCLHIEFRASLGVTTQHYLAIPRQEITQFQRSVIQIMWTIMLHSDVFHTISLGVDRRRT